MTTSVPALSSLPTIRPAGRPLDPPDELGALREHAPLARMRYPDGHLGWLATGHHVVRAILGDRRFSARYELMHLPFPGTDVVALPPAALGDLTGIDPPEHTRYRSLLVGYFTVRRMRALASRIEVITAELLDAMDRHGGPIDLMAAYAGPLPAPVICELLGVPYADHEFFQAHTRTLTSHHSTGDELAAAITAVYEYLLELVIGARTHPGEDVLSALGGSDVSDAELAGLGSFLLGAGLETTTNMLALGTFTLLQHPDQLAALRADPDGLADPAVEELLRYLTIGHTGARAALEDVELEGQIISAGETVTLAMQAANRDPRQFPAPDTLDLRRRTTGQLAFGHGIHQCLGQQLARVEMRIGLPALLTRFPTLRLDVAPSEVPMRPDANLYGVHRLPVAWTDNL